MEKNDIGDIANGLLLDGKALEALKVTRDHVKLHPSESSGYYWLGVAQLFLRKYEAALETFEAGLRLRTGDPEIYFGMAVVHYSLGNYQFAGKFMEAFLSRPGLENYSDDEMTGRACMLSAAGAFTAGLLFLEYLNTHRPARSAKLDEMMTDLYGDYMNYALKEKPRLGDTWLTLKGISPADKNAVHDLVVELIGELSWGDAIYLYRKHLDDGCSVCSKGKKEDDCLQCLTHRLLPPNYLFTPPPFGGAPHAG